MFQSTRPIQASTRVRQVIRYEQFVSIHEAYTGLDTNREIADNTAEMFQSTRPIQASTSRDDALDRILEVSIHEAYTGLDWKGQQYLSCQRRFNPRGLYRPRLLSTSKDWLNRCFNPRGLYRPRRIARTYRFCEECFNPRGLYRPRPF